MVVVPSPATDILWMHAKYSRIVQFQMANVDAIIFKDGLYHLLVKDPRQVWTLYLDERSLQKRSGGWGGRIDWTATYRYLCTGYSNTIQNDPVMNELRLEQE